MSREALVLLVCCCDFRDGAEWLIPSKSLRNAVIWAFPGLLCILRMCAPRRAAAVVRPRGREKSADRRRRILISRLLIIRASVPRWKSPFPAYFKGFPAVSPLIPPYPAFLKYPVSPQLERIIECIGPRHGAKKELAEHLGIHPNVITNWLNGRNKSYRRYVNEIAAFYGVSVDYLLGNADSKEKQPDSQNENQAVKDELIAFYGDVKDDLTPDDIDDLMVAMRAKAERNKKKKSGV